MSLLGNKRAAIRKKFKIIGDKEVIEYLPREFSMPMPSDDREINKI